MKPPKIIVFTKSGTCGFKLPCERQPVSSLTLKATCTKEASHQTRLSALAFMLSANKFKKQAKLKASPRPEMMF